MTSKITDHAARALDFLLSQFDESTNLRATLQAFGDAVQAFEDTAYGLEEDTLDNAVGIQLDEQYGNLVGQPRLGLSDEEYRAILRVRILINRSEGIIDRVLATVETFVSNGAGTVYGTRYVLLGPQGYSVNYVLTDWTDPLDELLVDAMQQFAPEMSPSGVQVEILEGYTLPEPYFGFDHDPNASGYNDTAARNTRRRYPVPLEPPAPPYEPTFELYARDLYGVYDDTDPVTAWSPAAGGSGDLVPLVGAPTYARQGGLVERGAAQFQTGRALDVGESPIVPTGTDPFTILLRVRMRSTAGGTSAILWQGQNLASNFLFLAFNGSSTSSQGFGCQVGPTDLVEIGTIDTDWHDIVITRGTGNIEIFQINPDGTIASDSTADSGDSLDSDGAIIGSAPNALSGPYNDVGVQSFYGDIDLAALVVYDRELSSTEIEEALLALGAVEGQMRLY